MPVGIPVISSSVNVPHPAGIVEPSNANPRTLPLAELVLKNAEYKKWILLKEMSLKLNYKYHKYLSTLKFQFVGKNFINVSRDF